MDGNLWQQETWGVGSWPCLPGIGDHRQPFPVGPWLPPESIVLGRGKGAAQTWGRSIEGAWEEGMCEVAWVCADCVTKAKSGPLWASVSPLVQ